MNMPPPPHDGGSDGFREQLSAWHDGELGDEASRFVLRRALHDAAVRAELGRWQAVGDVLRRQAQRLPRPGFADAVAAAIEADGVVPRPATVPSARPPRARAGAWWAAAAGVAFAALLWRPGVPQEARPQITAALPIEVPIVPIRRVAPMPLRPAPEPVAVARADAVPPLVRAPQPTPEQLAPLPSVDAPSKPWPRGADRGAVYTVDYALPAGQALPQP